MAKMKVGKAKTSHGEKSVPFNMPKTAGATGADKMGAMGMGMKKGGKVKKYARGGGIELRGKTRGEMV